MTTHQWTSSTPLRRNDTDETIEQGEAFEPTDSELRAFGDFIDEIDAEPAAETANESEDTTPFDEDAWFEDHDDYTDRVATVESGAVDEVLDEIEAVDDSGNVQDAIEERRADLED